MVAAGLMVVAAAGCASRAAATPASTVASGAATQPSSALGAGVLPAPRADPDRLAPAGPAPGGHTQENDGQDEPAAAAIARSIDCVDAEVQAHLPSVEEQLTCRRGTEQAYIMTFRSTTDRDTYLTRGPQVVPGGFDVVGRTWVVHVVARATATALATQLAGAVQPAAP